MIGGRCVLRIPVYILASGPNGGQVHLVKIESVYAKSNTKLNCPEAVYDFARKHLYANSPAEEIVYMIGINAKCLPLAVSEISHGSIDRALVGVREIMIRALLMGASEFILVHNHVSGDAEPSCEDVCLTWRIYELSNQIGLPMAEHVIVGENDFTPIIGGNKITRVHNSESIISDLFMYLNNSYMYFDAQTVMEYPEKGTIELQFSDGKWAIAVAQLPPETVI